MWSFHPLVFLFLAVFFVTTPASAFLATSPARVFYERTAVGTPSGSFPQATPSLRRNNEKYQPVSFIRKNQRKSVANVQMMGLFGLGAPEIVIILVAAAFLLGPDKLSELGKDAGKIAGELKTVPKEFQKGLEEGEIEARSRIAKPMEKIESSEDAKSSS